MEGRAMQLGFDADVEALNSPRAYGVRNEDNDSARNEDNDSAE